MMKHNTKHVITAVVANLLICFLHALDMTVQTEVFVGTQANTTILDLTVYFQNKFEAALTDQGCSSTFSVGTDMRVRLVETPVRSQGNTTNCEIWIWNKDEIFVLPVLFINIKYYGCWPDVDDRGLLWEAALPNTTVVKTCRKPFTGVITRTCGYWDRFLDPVYNCRDSVENLLDKLYHQLNTTNIDRKVVAELLQELSQTTVSDKNGLHSTVVRSTVNALRYLTEEKFRVALRHHTVYTPLFHTASNLFDTNNTRAWQELMGQHNFGAEQLVAVMDKTMMHIATMVSDDDNIEGGDLPIIYQGENLMLSMGSTTLCNQTMIFPNRNTDIINWVKNTRNSIRIPCDDSPTSDPISVWACNIEFTCVLMKLMSADGSRAFSSTYYRNISKLISRNIQSGERNYEINSGVMTFSLYGHREERLKKNVDLHFELYNAKMEKPLCSFWSEPKGTKSSGFWSSRGCHVKRSGDDIVVCSCDHLTNFAILMSPVETPQGHAEILSILSMVGCVVSMMFLMITIFIYVGFWRHVTARNYDGSVILLNLCGSLFVAYLVFLTGVLQTDNKAGCTAVAALLHYLFLVVFFTMLAEGVLLIRMVVWPLVASIRIAWKLMIGIWALPGVICAFSLGISRTEGYGNDKFCWLTVDSGLIWSFVGPALVIIVVNCFIIAVVVWKMLRTAVVQSQNVQGKIKYATRSLAVVLPLVGVTWVLGVFSISKDLVVFQYIFVILNTLQGLAIFICHCALNKTVRNALKRTKEKLMVSRSLGDKMKGASKSGSGSSGWKVKLFRTATTESTELAIHDDKLPYRSTN